MTIYKLSEDGISISEVVKINVPNAVYNRGLEGVAYGRDTLYIVNQASPTRLFKYSLLSKTISYIDVSFATYLSDVCFDETDNTLWIVDSKRGNIIHCDRNANVLHTQSISFIAKAEGLAIDRQKKIAWVGCDSSSKLYKVKLKN